MQTTPDATSPTTAASSSTQPVPLLAAGAVLVPTNQVPTHLPEVRGYDFNKFLTDEQGRRRASPDLEGLLNAYLATGFQATQLGRAVREIERMRSWRLSQVPVAEDEDDDLRDIAAREKVRCKIFLGYTSNLISSGLRDTFRFLVEHAMVNVVVSTAGGVEEDLIKCLGPTYVSDFHAKSGAEWRAQGINRIGNLLVPNSNYCAFEDWINPILDAMLEEQQAHGVHWTPSKMIHRLGKEIDDPSSVCYWAYRNNIPVYSPALTDGSIGDMLYFHTFKNPGLVLDIVEDIRRMNDEALRARCTGMIILGGGLVKHHICNANLMRNGADFSVFINTAQEFDGSDAGARPDEAISWGKIRHTAEPVKVYADAALVFPLLVAQTFAKDPAASSVD